MNYTCRTLLGSILVASQIFLVPPTSANSPSKDKAAIRSEIQKMETASNSKDADSYIKFTHPNFISIDQSGQETTHGKEERQEKLKWLFAHANKIMGKTTVTRIELNKQGAVVDKNSVFSVAMTQGGQNVEMKGSGNYRDFWVKEVGVWLQKKSRTLNETTTDNGQPVP